VTFVRRRIRNRLWVSPSFDLFLQGRGGVYICWKCAKQSASAAFASAFHERAGLGIQSATEGTRRPGRDVPAEIE
jgi:hypothetical protein